MNKRIKRQFRAEHRNIPVEHIKANIDIYFLLIILFFIGMILGVIIVNNLPKSESQNIDEYVHNSFNSIKEGNKLQDMQTLKYSLEKNTIIVLIIWIFGLSFFGKYILYFAIFLLGITFGYTTSSIFLGFNIGQSMLIFLSTMFLQNIIIIPTFLFLCEQGIKCHKDFSKNTSSFSLKHMLVKFTSYCLLSLLLLFASSFIEVYVSGKILNGVVKYL